MKVADHTATSRGARASSTKQGPSSKKSHFYGSRYLNLHNAENKKIGV